MKENKLKQRFNKLKNSYLDRKNNPEEFDNYYNSLKEEGLKNLFIVPLLQDYLGYEDVEDYSFEKSLDSVKYSRNESIDILLIDKFVIETKNFGTLDNEKDFLKAQDQIRKYIKPKDDKIESGLLTDGINYYLYMDKAYIERRSTEDNELPEFTEDLPLCINFTIDHDLFYDLILFFHKSVIEENLKKLSDGIVKIVKKKRGGFAWQNLFSKVENSEIQNKCGLIVRDQISNIFKVKEGYYFEDLKAGKLEVGDRYVLDNKFFSIEYEILENGFIEIIEDRFSLKEASPNEVTGEFPNIITLMFDKWNNEKERQYESPEQILLELKNRHRVTGEIKSLLDGIRKV